MEMEAVDILKLLLPEIKVNPYLHNPLSTMARVLFLSIPVLLIPSLRKSIVTFFMRFGKQILYALSIVLVFGYLLIFLWYCSVDEFFDHVEPAVVSVSWLFVQGKPVYHGIDVLRLYNLPYGPMLFMINGIVLKLLGPSLKVSKLVSALSFLSALVSMFITYRKVVGGRRALVFFCAVLLLLHSFGYKGIWVRSDPILLLCVSAGILGAVSGGRTVSTAVVAFSMGMAMNLKMHALLYFLPVLALVFVRFGIILSLTSLFAASLIYAMPFIVFKNVSFNNYINSIRYMTAHNIVSGEVPKMFSWLLFLSLPPFIAFSFSGSPKGLLRDNSLFFISLGASMILVCIIGTVPGAGSHHMMPFIPLVGYGSILFIKEYSPEKKKLPGKECTLPLSVIWLSFSFIFASAVFLYSWTTISYLPLRSYSKTNNYLSEIRSIMRNYKGYTIGMGYGGYYRATYYRPLLVFEGAPYLLDAVTIMDTQLVTGKAPRKSLDILSECMVDIWLVPRGGEPFSTVNRYYNLERIFPHEVTELFLESGRYIHIKRTKYYDLWKCKH